MRVDFIVMMAALPLVLVDCGGGGASGGGGDGGTADGGGGGGTADAGAPKSSASIALADLCPVFTSDLCTYLLQCNHERYRDLDHCRAEVDCYGLADLTDAAMRGGVRYDPSSVAACHARFLGDPCNFGFFLFTPNIFDVLRYCPGTITPQQAQGQPCVSSSECVPGLYCDKDALGTCPGACTAYAKAGDACPSGVLCAPDLQCLSKVCRPWGADGAACTADADCGPAILCTRPPTCQDDNLWCDHAAGVCKKGGGAGAPCGAITSGTMTSHAECANELWCDNLFIDKPGTCRVLGGEGSPCNDYVSCNVGLHCAGYVSLGPAATLGRCAVASAVAGVCRFSSDCQAGLRCMAGACAAPLAFGDRCGTDADCQPGLTCPDERCIHARYPGDACSDTDADATCVLSVCKDGRCHDHAKVGQPCALNLDCATGYCAAGQCADTSVCKRR